MSTLNDAMDYLADHAVNLDEWESAKNLSLTGNINCSGTRNGSIVYRLRKDHKAILLYGRVYISSYSRSGANPGVRFTVPEAGFPNSGIYCGSRGESGVEAVTINLSQGTLTTTETFSNATGTRLTLIIPCALILKN